MDVKKFLENLKDPDEIKKLSKSEIDELTSAIREILIETVSHTGGHLASNLGVVELTIALLLAFNFPEDSIVWDVGHQVYTYKLLTGRYNDFHKLRTENGISGFSRPDESIYDSFYTGHSGASLSTAYGLSKSKELTGDNGFVVDVIGDGSFTNGMVYEALNNTGRTAKNLIVILNDNKMSISKNVGALSKYFTKIRTHRKYFRLKAHTERLLNKIPCIGHHLSRSLYHLKNTLKTVVYGTNFFEDLGYRYMGPVDGHNIEKLTEMLEMAKESTVPVLLHVKTVKGKGYDFAEKSPSTYHGISKFDINTGEPIASSGSFSDEFGRMICEMAEENDKICAITAAMKLSTGLKEFSKKFPDRFFDVGIAEEHAVAFACGLAKKEMIPVFTVYSTFLQRCYDQLIHDGALQRQKMIIAVDRAGFVGEDGETHQGVFDVAMLNSIPNTVVYSPSTYKELYLSFKHAVNSKEKSLFVIRYPRGDEKISGENIDTLKPYNIYGDTQANNAIVTYGRLFAYVNEAQKQLEKKGIRTKVINLNMIKPIDEKAVEAVLGCERIFFFEEGIKSAGVNECFAQKLFEKSYKGKYKTFAIDDEFVKQATVASQLKKYKLDTEGIVESVIKECNDIG
ncbi:MAG: 1-deoxy-D-xylulose-5-phosphate synthase [Clostridia bacterium]|nr:1-deoxy-D-xylulose-5-phosphate synthase [Clostridia bacterium]